MLEGLKVVELATYIAAPGAGGIMADWGAEVVKIEPPKGDPMRGFFDTLGSDQTSNPVFELDNRGKRGVVLDIAQPLGREAALKLVRGADVFLTNIRPSALQRAGFDWEALRLENPRLIYSSVTGYGLQGPDADKAGMDIAAFWSRSGVGSLTTPKGVDPFPLRTGLGDHTCSLATVSAILAAVIERGRTGKGRLVETSLMRSGAYAISSDMAIQLRLGRIASTRSREQAVQPLANFFKTADGRWFTIVVRQGGADWPQIAAAAGRPELTDDPRFASSRARRENGPALVAALDEGFGAVPYAELAARLDAADITWAPYQTPRELTQDPQAHAAGCFVQATDAQGATFTAPAGPARFPGADDGPKGPAPSLGQHTTEVLAELGYSDADIAAMREAGAAA